MKNAKKLICLLLVAVMALSLFAGCGNNTTAEVPQETASAPAQEAAETATEAKVEYADTLIYTMTASPVGGFIPVGNRMSVYTGGVCELIYASLMVSNGEGTLEPYLAESCTINEDGTVYTYKLHENATWSDGEPLTAEDVVFTFMLAASPENDGSYSTSAGFIKGVKEYREGTADTVEGIKVIDDYTIEFTTDGYYSKAESFFGQLKILPKHIWEGIPYPELGNVDREMQDYPVCSGPYIVKELVVDEYVKLEANPNFFLGEPLTKNFIIKIVNDESVSAELMSGSVDIAEVTNLTTGELETLQGQGFNVLGYYHDMFQVCQFNNACNFSEDFRNACFYALDRQGMVDSLMDGRGTVIDMVMSAASWAYPDDVESPARDLEKAKQYLDAAGYKDIDGDGFVEDPEGNPFSMNIIYTVGLLARERSAVVIQSNLADIGIKVELSSFADIASLAVVMDQPDQWELMLMGFNVESIDPDPTTFVHFFNFSDRAKEVNNQAAMTFGSEARAALYKQLCEIQIEEQPVLMLYCQERSFAYPENLVNYAPGTYNPYYNAHLWALEQ